MPRKWSIGDREIDNCWFNQPRKIAIGKFYKFEMRAGVEGDLLVAGQRRVRINAESIEVSEWRHRSDFTIQEAIFEVALTCERNVFAVCELREH